jgi:acylphosphatase
MESKARAHVWIEGRVQGVAFRWETQQAAARQGINGWVRNLSDGRVEAVFEGERPAVIQVLDWCRQGPRAARVDSVDIHWENFTGQFPDFAITR